MDDLVLVYDKLNVAAGKFASGLYNHSKKWIGMSVQEPKPNERTSFTVGGTNIGIIVTPGMAGSPFVTDALELAVGAKKAIVLIHDVNSKCVVADELDLLESDEYKHALAKCQIVTFTFDFADPCLDNLVNVLEFKSADTKKDLQRQAALRGEELRSDILLFSSRVAKGRLSAAVHRKYDFCLTCADQEVPAGEEALQQVFDALGKYAPALIVARNQGDKSITNMSQKTSNIRDSFNLVVVATEGCFETPEGKGNALLEEIKAALESELQVSIIQHLDKCPDIDKEIESCSDLVLRSCLQRAMRFIYLEGSVDATCRALLAEPGSVKTDDTKTPRTRAAGVASFKLNYKNSQAIELAADGRLGIYKSALYEMKNKKIPGDVEGCIKGLFELYDTEKKGRISWALFAEIDRLMVETLGGQYSEMISRRIYSMMLYPGLTLESEISYTTFYNYHSFIAKEMGIFEGDSRDVSIHYKYISDKVKHMKKGKRFQKKYDLYITHDRSKFSREFATQLMKSIRAFTPNIRFALCTDYDKKEDDKDDKKKKEVKKEETKNTAPIQSLNVLVLLKADCLTKDIVQQEINMGVEGGAQILVMCHIAKTPLLELEVKKAPADIAKQMRRLPVFAYSPDNDASCVTRMLDQMFFPDWKPVANKAKTFRKNENPLVLYLFQKCEDEEECANALQAIANVTSPSSVHAEDFGYDFYKDGGLVILQERFANFGTVPMVCEAAARCVANISSCTGSHSGEVTERMCELGTLNCVVDAINNHVDATMLQGEGCRAVCNVAAQSTLAKKMVNEKLGFQLVLAAQKRNEELPEFWDGRFEMKRLNPQDELMVNYEGQGRWISGVVLESYSNGTYDVKYAHGGMGRRVSAHLVRPKDASDKMLEFCATWLWKPSGKLTEDELLIKPDGMVSLAESGQVGTWSVADTEGRAAIKLQIGTLMIEMERISVTTMRATASPHRAVLRDEFRDCLVAQYFNYEDIESSCGALAIPPFLGRKPDVSRLEQEINRPQGNGQPWTGLDMQYADNFGTRLAGKLIIRKMGKYTFDFSADSAASLRIGARSIQSKEVYEMFAGAHTIRLDYCAKNAMEKKLLLRYSGPDTNEDMVVIPAAVLQHDKGGTEMVEKPGFIAEYFPVDASEKMVMLGGDPDITRIDKQLDFDISLEAWPRLPEKLYGKGGWCARYTGYLTVTCGDKKKAMYKFLLESNKRAKLYLNDQLLIDPENTTADIELKKGQHLLRVEYFSKPGEAHGLKLKYSGPETLPKQTKEEADAEKAAWEEYEKLRKARQAFLDDPPEPEEGEEPPQPPPEPVAPPTRIPEITMIGPTVVSYYAPDSCLVPKGDPLAKHEKACTFVAFSHDDGMLVSGGADGKICIWSYVTGEYQGTIDIGSPVCCLAFPGENSIKGDAPSTLLNLNVVAVGLENGNIALYDVVEGSEVKVLTGHTGPVTSVEFHPCRGEDVAKPPQEAGRRGSMSKEAQRRPSKTEVEGEVPAEEGAEGGVARMSTKELAAAQSLGTKPNLISSSRDGTIRMWNTGVGEETTPPGFLINKGGPGNKETIPQLAVSISCDGTGVVSGGADGKFRYFSMTIMISLEVRQRSYHPHQSRRRDGPRKLDLLLQSTSLGIQSGSKLIPLQ